ncbi:MAG: nitrate/nitrite transporter NrtS [Candidatus Binatia bacterium]|nr:nitrate/nitrite transporter NrtS [Candidatus Binatia bacterium]
MRTEPSFLQLASERSVVRRALALALVVGPILIAINHGDRLVAGDVDGVRLFKMSLTILVPYCVSTYSSVGAIRADNS